MSPRQYTMLGQFIVADHNIAEVRQLNQLTMGSLIYRKWIKQKADKFVITNAGQEAYYSYGTQNILRKNFASAMSRYVKGVY